MAKRLTYTQPNKLTLLHEELVATGITPLAVEGLGDNIAITVEDEVANSAVQTVVTAHNPSGVSAGEIVEQEVDSATSDFTAQYAAAITRLDAIINNGAAYTANQVRDAVIDEARMLRRLARYLHARMD